MTFFFHILQRLGIKAAGIQRTTRGFFFVFAAVFATAFLYHWIGFYICEKPESPDLTWFDSLWVTVITMTTIGYGDMAATTRGGRAITISFAILCLAAVGVLFGQLFATIWNRYDRRNKGMAKLNIRDHFLIIDLGDNIEKIEVIVRAIRSHPDTKHTPIVIVSDAIERLPESVSEAYLDVEFCRGKSTDERVYDNARVAYAKKCILAANSGSKTPDKDTAATIAFLKYLEPGLHVVAQCLEKRSQDYLYSVGASEVITTQDAEGILLSQGITSPMVAQVHTEISDPAKGCTIYREVDQAFGGYTFEQVAKALRDLKEQPVLIGVIRNGRNLLIPEGSTVLNPDDGLLYLGRAKASERDLQKVLGTLKTAYPQQAA